MGSKVCLSTTVRILGVLEVVLGVSLIIEGIRQAFNHSRFYVVFHGVWVGFSVVTAALFAVCVGRYANRALVTTHLVLAIICVLVFLPALIAICFIERNSDIDNYYWDDPESCYHRCSAVDYFRHKMQNTNYNMNASNSMDIILDPYLNFFQSRRRRKRADVVSTTTTMMTSAMMTTTSTFITTGDVVSTTTMITSAMMTTTSTFITTGPNTFITTTTPVPQLITTSFFPDSFSYWDLSLFDSLFGNSAGSGGYSQNFNYVDTQGMYSFKCHYNSCPNWPAVRLEVAQIIAGVVLVILFIISSAFSIAVLCSSGQDMKTWVQTMVYPQVIQLPPQPMQQEQQNIQKMGWYMDTDNSQTMFVPSPHGGFTPISQSSTPTPIPEAATGVR